MLTADRGRFAGKRVLVVGAGHSAANTLIKLARLARQEPSTQITWAIRGTSPIRVFPSGNDELEERGKLGGTVHQLVRDGAVTLLEDGQVLGWAALSPVSSRTVYRGVAEHSLYIKTAARGRGIGTALLAALLDAADEAGLWTVQARIFPENTASLAFHDRAGFRRIGRRERIALMTYGPAADTWRDTILIERRRP